MKAPARPATVPRRPAASSSDSSEAGLSWLAAAAWVAGLSLVIMAAFLWMYPRRGQSVPLGWDTARYLWRTALTRTFGLGQLLDVVPSYLRPDPARPAFLVLASMMSSLLRTSVIELSALFPGVGAAAVGLATGCFVAVGLRRRLWQVAAVTLGVGISVFVVRMAGPEGYQDMVFASAVLMAAATSIVLANEDRRALLPAIVLFGIGGVTHWAFFLIMAATIGATAALYLPRSLARWRRGDESLLDTSSARLGGVLLGGAALTGTVMLGIVSATPNKIIQSPADFARKLRRTARAFFLPIMLPVATVGAVSAWLESRRPDGHHERIRFVLVFLLAWCGVVVAGVIANLVLGLRVAGHRFLAFGLAIAIFQVLGVLWVADRFRRTKPPALGRTLAALVVVVGIGASIGVAALRWSEMSPVIKPVNLRESAAAGAYLSDARIGDNRPVVFVVNNRDWSYFALMGHIIRGGLPPARIRDTYFYAGSAEDYLARRPTLDRSDGRRPGLSRNSFRKLEGTYGRDPVGLILSSFNRAYYERWTSRHPGSVVAPGVAVVRGPSLPSALSAPAPARVRLSLVKVIVLAPVLMAVLLLAGLGWTFALLGPWLRRFEVLAVSPAVGIGFLVLGGVLIDALGVRLSGSGGALSPMLIAAVGWGVAAFVHARRRRRRPDVASGESEPRGRLTEPVGDPSDSRSLTR